MDRSTLSRRARPSWWIVALVWAVPATIAMLQVVEPAMFATRGVTTRDWTLAATQFARYMLWAPLTPLIFAAVRRFPFQRPQLARSMAIHACFALLCIAFVEALTEQLQSLILVNAGMLRPQTGRAVLSFSLGPIFSR